MQTESNLVSTDLKGNKNQPIHYVRGIGAYLILFPVSLLMMSYGPQFQAFWPLICSLTFFAPILLEPSRSRFTKVLDIGLATTILLYLVPLDRTVGVLSFFALLGFAQACPLGYPFLHSPQPHQRLKWKEIFILVMSTVVFGGLSLWLMEWVYLSALLAPFPSFLPTALAGAALMCCWDGLSRRSVNIALSGREFPLDQLGEAYGELALRQKGIQKRIEPILSRELELKETTHRILAHNQLLLEQGNELYEFLRVRKVRISSEGGVVHLTEETFQETKHSPEKSRQMKFWKERMETLCVEERRIHELIETNLLKLENLESFLISQKAESLHSTQRELEQLSEVAFEKLEMKEDRRKILEELEDSW